MGLRTVSKAVRTLMGYGDRDLRLPPYAKIHVETEISIQWLSFLEENVMPRIKNIDSVYGFAPDIDLHPGMSRIGIVLLIPEADAILIKLSGKDIAYEFEMALVDYVESRWGYVISTIRL